MGDQHPGTELTTKVSYAVDAQAIARLGKQYNLTAIETKEDYELARKGIAEFRGLRGKVEDRRVKLKSKPLAFIRQIDGEAKRLTGLLFDRETPLKDLKKAADDAEAAKKLAVVNAERERVEKIDGMINDLRKAVAKHYKDSAEAIRARQAIFIFDVNEADFQEKTQEAIDVQRDVLRVLDQVIVIEQRKEVEAAEAKEVLKKQQAEAAKLAEQRKKLDADQAKADAKRAEESAEHERMKADLKKFQDKEQAEREAKEKEERDKAEATAKEKADAAAKARTKALKPDKQKLTTYADSLEYAILSVENPRIKNELLQVAAVDGVLAMKGIVDSMRLVAMA